MMAANIRAWLFPVLLGVTCTAMVIHFLHTRKINNTLTADLLFATYETQECSKNLEAKNAEMRSKDEQVAGLTNDVKTLTEEKTKVEEQVADLTNNVNTLTEEKTKVEEQLHQLTAQLKQAGKESGGPSGGPSGLTELRSEEDFIKIDPECVDTPEFYGGVKSKMCIMAGETFSETNLKANGVFEGDTVNTIVKAMTVYPDATFIDCGANIGMVTTVIAAMGRKVVSVDPLKEHLSHLRKALELLGNQDNVRLLHNAVGNESGILFPYTDNPANKEGNAMYTEEEIKKNNWTPIGPAVNVVTVMEILATIPTKTVILKVDVEGFECRAVSREVAGQSGHLIPFIIMEWTLLQEDPEYAACVDWLFDGGYTAHNYVSYDQYTREEVKALNAWYGGAPTTHDLIWLHSTADPVLLKP